MSKDIPLTAKNLRRVPKDLVPVVKNAAKMGWTGRKHGNGGLLLHSPDGHTQVTIPITVSSRSATTNIARQILRATPRQDIEAGIGDNQDPEVARDIVEALEAARGPLGVDLDTLVDSGPEPEPEPPARDEQDDEQDTVVSITPFLARASVDPERARAGLYASRAINVRHWSSGKVDYACAFPGCPYTSDKSRSVQGHWSSHRTPSGLDRTVVAHEDAAAPLYRPRATRLAREITEAMAQVPGEGLSREQYARALAEHILTRRREQGADDQVEETPRTPEQILGRMRALLMPDLLANEEQMRTAVQELTAETERLRSRVTAAEAATERYKETLATLASLAQEEGELDG